jgi:hypothetical protein
MWTFAVTYLEVGHIYVERATPLCDTPSTLKPYEEGDLVRLANAKYLKASTRSNALKMGPRWSRTMYEITKVRGSTGVPEYRVQPADDLHKDDLDKPELVVSARPRAESVLA